MIINDFDNTTEPIVNLETFYGKKKHIVDTCLIVFSKAIHDYMVKTFECDVIGEISACNGDITIYSFTNEGEKIAFYLSPIGSAVASGSVYEAHWQVGATQFIMFGSCGSLDGEKTHGKYIIPTECYRGEGASYYYKEPADYIEITTAERLAKIFDELEAPYVMGRVWTTDSILRETAGLVNKRKEEGCIAVDMELAGVQALCDFYHFELYNFLEAGDVLEESHYDVRGLPNANHGLGKLSLALDIAQRI